MAEDLMREIHTQLNLITNDLAGTAPERIALRGFAEPPTSSRCTFLKEINGYNLCSKSVFDEEAQENIVEKVQRIVLSKDSAEM